MILIDVCKVVYVFIVKRVQVFGLYRSMSRNAWPYSSAIFSCLKILRSASHYCEDVTTSQI